MQNTYHYGADTSAKEFSTWDATISSPDQELLNERDPLVARSRDFERNSGIISGLYQTYEDNIIGTQYRLSSRPDYIALGKDKAWADEWSRHVEARWRLYSESTDCDAARMQNFHGLTKQVLGSLMSTGEALSLVMWMRQRQSRTAFQLVDTDRLSNPDSNPYATYGLNGANIHNGVEINDFNEEIAFHFRNNHPGDDLHKPQSSSLWTRVPARTRFGRRRVLHVIDAKRIGQHRAKPVVTSVMGDLKQMSHYKKFELKNKITQSLIAAFLKSNMDAQQIGAAFDADWEDFKDGRKKWNANLNGGDIITLYPGDEMQQFNPSGPSAAYAEYMDSMLDEVAAGANISVTTLMKNYSKTNYSSAKAAMQDSLKFFLGRKKLLSDMWGTPCFALWMEEEIDKGEIEAPDFYKNQTAYTRCKWIGGARGYVDEAKEASSAVIRMKSKTSTLEQENANQGNDWEETLQQQLVEDQRVMETQAILLKKKKELEEKYDIKLDMPNYEGVPEPLPRATADGEMVDDPDMDEEDGQSAENENNGESNE